MLVVSLLWVYRGEEYIKVCEERGEELGEELGEEGGQQGEQRKPEQGSPSSPVW